MTKIALIGYGKMGRMVEDVAIQKGHTIFSKQDIHLADVCIDFSHPSVVLENIQMVAKAGKNLVVGTTGWYDHINQVQTLVEKTKIGFLYAPNFSIGVHLFLKMVSYAASLINQFDEYDVGVIESHHNKKADSPSGTANAICNVLLQNIDRKKTIVSDGEQISPSTLQVSSLRCGSIPGTHSVLFDSQADTITLTHQARNREGFARGAVSAAEWLQGKKGFFTLEEMIGG
jgi:4-hydroxy-tetrahydrodipicolinate reductase